jgi:hypothetical protein
MLISVCNREVLHWHDDTYVFVYNSANECQHFCQIKDLSLYDMKEQILRFGAEKVFLEPADENKNLCIPKEKYFPPECVGPEECTYPGVCYRFETEQQDYECFEGNECLGGDDND